MVWSYSAEPIRWRPDLNCSGTPTQGPLAQQGVSACSFGVRCTPEVTRPCRFATDPILLIRSHTTLMPNRTAQCCHVIPSTGFRWSLYRPVPRRWVADRVAERSAARDQISSVGAPSEVAPQDLSWRAREHTEPPLRAFARQGVTMLKFDPRSSSEPSSSPSSSRLPST